jgi:hypothetical protein
MSTKRKKITELPVLHPMTGSVIVPVVSDGITHQATVSFDVDPIITENSTNPVNSGGIWNFVVPTVETFSEAYQLLTTDTNKIKRCTSAIDIDFTIPLDLALPMPVGIEQAGNGVVTVVGAIGVTLNGDSKTGGQYKHIVIMKVAANTYTIIGGVE